MTTKTTSKKNNGSSAKKTSAKQEELHINMVDLVNEAKNKEIRASAAIIMSGVLASRTQYQLQNLNVEELAAFSMLCAKRLDVIADESTENLKKIVTMKGITKK